MSLQCTRHANTCTQEHCLLLKDPEVGRLIVANAYQRSLPTLKLSGVSALKAKSSLGGLGIIKILLPKPSVVALVCNPSSPGAEAGLRVWGQLELPNKTLPQKKQIYFLNDAAILTF